MKSVLVVFDGLRFPESALEFALDMNRETRIKVTGIFTPFVDFADAMSFTPFSNPWASILGKYEKDAVAVKANIARFEAYCKVHNLLYSVHQNAREEVSKVLQRATRYADLLILSSVHFYQSLGQMVQEGYLYDTLHKAECPVVLLPGSYTRPENIILAYDGSASCMHAIKQFTYLFPQWTRLATLVMYADNTKGEIPFLPMIEVYTLQHFNKPDYQKLDANPQKYFTTWLENKGATLVVSGSYGRSHFSELFRRNFFANVIKEHKVPLFMAHL